MVAAIKPHKCTQHRHPDRDREHWRETVGEQTCGRSGNHKHGDYEHDSHDLQRHHARERQHHQKQRAKSPGAQPDSVREPAVEGVQNKIAAFNQQDTRHDDGENSYLPDVRPGYAQHVPEKNMVQVGA